MTAPEHVIPSDRVISRIDHDLIVAALARTSGHVLVALGIAREPEVLQALSSAQTAVDEARRRLAGVTS